MFDSLQWAMDHRNLSKFKQDNLVKPQDIMVQLDLYILGKIC